MANLLDWVAKTFSKDASKMLIFTGVAGWALSSLAQIAAILVNPKIKEEQKVFLIPQEISDALVNIGAFFLITQFTKKTTSKLFSTGKFAPKSVREYLNKHSDIYEKKVGKLDFDIDNVIKIDSNFPKEAYYKMKNFGTAFATVCAGVVASNIVTPLLRNKMASNVQKTYINEFKNTGSKESDTIKKTEVLTPNNNTDGNAVIHTVNRPQIKSNLTGSSMRI